MFYMPFLCGLMAYKILYGYVDTFLVLDAVFAYWLSVGVYYVIRL